MANHQTHRHNSSYVLDYFQIYQLIQKKLLFWQVTWQFGFHFKCQHQPVVYSEALNLTGLKLTCALPCLLLFHLLIGYLVTGFHLHLHWARIWESVPAPSFVSYPCASGTANKSASPLSLCQDHRSVSSSCLDCCSYCLAGLCQHSPCSCVFSCPIPQKHISLYIL